jgi:outer membrane protein OmpA-like peptidoglycan-associated protein
VTNTVIAQSSIEGENKKDVKIKSIYFGGGSYYIDAEQELQVYEWLEEIENIHQYQIRIESHTDNIGSKSYNQYLSEMRSEAARILLSNYHTELVNVSVGDFGEELPDFDNQHWQGKLRNRRVDIILRKLEF